MNTKTTIFIGTLLVLISGVFLTINHGLNSDKPAVVNVDVIASANEDAPASNDAENLTVLVADVKQSATAPNPTQATDDHQTDAIKPATPQQSNRPNNTGDAPVAAPNTSNSGSRVSRAVPTDFSKYPLVSKANGSYGQFHYRNLSGGRIEADPQWIKANIVTITLPGLNRQVQVHREAADNFIKAFTYIKNGTAVINGRQVSLLSLIRTMDGTWVTRHVNWDPSRGLSNHSWGTAIDINAANHFRYVNPGTEGSDPNLILWEKAFKPAGFSWGNSYADAMHYELLD